MQKLNTVVLSSLILWPWEIFNKVSTAFLAILRHSRLSSLKLFTVDPYFGGMFKTGLPKSAKLAHLGIFRHIGGVGSGRKITNLKIY